MRARRLAVRRFRRDEAGEWTEEQSAALAQRLDRLFRPPARHAPAVGDEWLLIVEHDGWRMAIARGDRAEVERIYRSMSPTVIGLRMEAA